MTQKNASDFMGYIKFSPVLIGFILAIAIDLSFRVGGFYNIALAMLVGGLATGYMINSEIKGILINCGILGIALGIILAIFNIAQYFITYSSYQMPIYGFMSYAGGTVVMAAIAGAIIGIIGGIIGVQINKNTYHDPGFEYPGDPLKKDKVGSEDEKVIEKPVQQKSETNAIREDVNYPSFQEGSPETQKETSKSREETVKTREVSSKIQEETLQSSLGTKVCPHCKSEIPVDAVKCRYCGESVELSGVKLAGVGSRFAALFIDSIIIVLFWAISTYLVNFTVPVSQSYGSDGSSTNLVVFPIYTLILFAYYIILEGPLGKGQTIGKKILKIRVVMLEDQSTIDYGVSFIRNILRAIDGLFMYFVGFMSIQGSDKKQRLGDKAAKTIVIKI